MYLDVKHHCTISELKQHVAGATNVPVERQKLCFAGNLLSDDDKSLSDYRISAFSVITMKAHPESRPANSFSSSASRSSLSRMSKSSLQTLLLNNCGTSANVSLNVLQSVGQLIATFSVHDKWLVDLLARYLRLLPGVEYAQSVHNVNKIHMRIIQKLHQRGIYENHPDYLRYLGKAKELAAQKDILEHPKKLQQVSAASRSLSRDEYAQYLRYRQEQQRLAQEPDNELTSELQCIVVRLLRRMGSLTHHEDELLRALVRMVDCVIESTVLRDTMLNKGIMRALSGLIDPCRPAATLHKLTQLCAKLCVSDNILSYSSAPISHVQDGDNRDWTFLEHLKVLILYEESADILESSLKQLGKLIHQHVISKCDIQKITNSVAYSSDVRSMYARKRDRRRLLFDGFMNQAAQSSNIGDMPLDMVAITFSYFDCYANIEFDVLQRLVNLVNVENGHTLEIREAALACLLSTQYGNTSEIVSEVLITRCDILAELSKLFEVKDGRKAFKRMHINACWTAQRVPRDRPELLLASGVVEQMMVRLNACILNANVKPALLSMAANILVPLCYILFSTFSDASCPERILSQLKRLLEDALFVKSVVSFLDHILVLDDVEYNKAFAVPGYCVMPATALINKVFDVLEMLLDIASTREMCRAQMQRHKGVRTLRKIRDNEMRLDVRLRTIALLSRYLQDRWRVVCACDVCL